MEPVSLIIAALTIGATAAIQGLAGEGIKDAYQGLKALIQHKFAGNPKAEMILDEHEKEPDVWEKPLKTVMMETGVDKDQEIFQRAQNLLSITNTPQNIGGKQQNIQNFGTVGQQTNLGDNLGTLNINPPKG